MAQLPRAWLVLMLAWSSACGAEPTPTRPSEFVADRLPDPIKGGARLPLPDGQGPASLTGAWSGVVASTPALEFGGPPYCYYTVEFADLRSSVQITAGRVVAAEVTATHIEHAIRGCPYPPDPPAAHTYRLNSATITDRRIAIRYDAAPANRQTAAVDFIGEISADQRSIAGTLTLQRVDQPTAPNLQWQVNVQVAMVDPTK